MTLTPDAVGRIAKQIQADIGDAKGVPHKQVTNAHAIGSWMQHRLPPPVGMGKDRTTVRGLIFEKMAPPAPPEPVLPPVTSHTDFVTNFLIKGATTLMLRGQTYDQRMRVYEAVHSRGFDTLLYYLYNEQDGAWRYGSGAIPFDGLTKGHDATLKLAQEIKDQGLHGCPILLPDDAPVLNGTRADKVYPSLGKIMTAAGELLPQLDAIMERKFCWAGLELNEYMSPDDVLSWAQFLHWTMPDWYVGLHYTSGRHGSCPTKDLRVSQRCTFTWQGDTYDIEITTIMDWWKWVTRLTKGKAGLSYQVGTDDLDGIREECEEIHERSLGTHGWPKFWVRYEESKITSNGDWVPESVINRRAEIAKEAGILGSGHGDNRVQADAKVA